ncbi:helix-turn-helix transcriptional regulator [Rhodobacteraceae bacterium]|nr:helix-turn-helix transcriptional regulator [Paracoccaceae bacterium]
MASGLENFASGNVQSVSFPHNLPTLQQAESVVKLLKAMAHEGRYTILLHLNLAERSVGELEDILDSRQAAVSQQLARLRQDGLVKPRRAGKTIYYRLADPRISEVLKLLAQPHMRG